MDIFKCERCGKTFGEFDADYNFMSCQGKELCEQCVLIYIKEVVFEDDVVKVFNCGCRESKTEPPVDNGFVCKTHKSFRR
jgi:hypothetical protein